MISIENVSLSHGSQDILKNLTLNIHEGQKVLLTGRSGAGKSSLLQLLMGFQQPDYGQISINKMPLNSNSIWSLRQQMAYVDQGAQIGVGSVRQQFSDMLRLKANRLVFTTEADLCAILEQLALPPTILNKDISHLSGGERQRVALGFAIALQRKLFLLDEVTASLDRHLTQHVASIFTQNPQWTCFIVSHDQVWSEQPEITIYDLEKGKWTQSESIIRMNESTGSFVSG